MVMRDTFFYKWGLGQQFAPILENGEFIYASVVLVLLVLVVYGAFYFRARCHTFVLS